MLKAPEKAYCTSCGEESPVRLVSIGIEGEELLQCVHCNSFLGTVSQPQTPPSPLLISKGRMPAPELAGEFHPDETTAGATILPDLPRAMETPIDAGSDLFDEDTADSAIESEKAGPPLETVITVEDSSLISAILDDLLIEQGLTNRVLSCKNGYEFLARFVRERIKKTKIGLIFMDVKMPVLNGISSAVALRAHEKALGLDNVPLLFFTSQRCDETFRKVLVHCAPAMYINKGTSSSPQDLQDRITKVIQQLMAEEW